MAEDKILTDINELLADAGHSVRVHNLNELRMFLSDGKNRRLDVYNQIYELCQAIIFGQGLW